MKKEQRQVSTQHTNAHEEHNPYHSSYREGKWEKMSLIRSTLIFSISVLTAAAMIVIYINAHNKYTLSNSKNGVFIFDRSTGVTNYCDMTGCVGISNGFIKPTNRTFAYQPGNALQAYMGNPTMKAPYQGGNPYGEDGWGASYPYARTSPYNYGNMPYGGGWGAPPHFAYPYPVYSYAPYPYAPETPREAAPPPQLPTERVVNPPLAAPVAAAPQTLSKYRLVEDEDMGMLVSSPEDRGEEIFPILPPSFAEGPSEETTTTTTEETTTEENPAAMVEGGLDDDSVEETTEDSPEEE